MHSNESTLLSPLAIRGITLKNRIVVSPMCQYIAKEGFADDWHLVHLGSRAVGGAGLIFTEATAVTPQGRISKGDLGIWSDDHIAPLKRIVDFIHRMGSISGIQLAHSGRKGSTPEPFSLQSREAKRGYIPPEEGGWEIAAPSPVPFYEDNPPPHELSIKEIKDIIEAFVIAAKRSLTAGFRVIEIHSAHGYLLHSFLSPLSNKRNDNYGGPLENRIRFLLEVIQALRSFLPDDYPLFVRISASDWVEGGWDIQQSVLLAKELKKAGVDLIDASSGGGSPHAVIPLRPGYQVPFAEEIKNEADILTGTVGLITKIEQANDIIKTGKADLIFLAREMLREPYFAHQAEEFFGQEASWPLPYGYAIKKKLI